MQGNPNQQPAVDPSLTIPSPLQKLESDFLHQHKIDLYIKRDDLIHPEFGGNKWRKLKYNLLEAKNLKHTHLLTFGGAWSNHIYATAAAGKAFGFKTIGVIRGEEKNTNACLSFARQCGMHLHYISRADYRLKTQHNFIAQLHDKFGDFYLIPEGGSNSLAIKGCRDIVEEIQTQADYICCACGTGTTLSGIISALASRSNKPQPTAIGFAVINARDLIQQEVTAHLSDEKITVDAINWQVETDYHFGGYAKINDELKRFMAEFNAQYKITLDAVYTAKMFYGLFHKISTHQFPAASKIIAIHSGGLQGNAGFNL